MLIDAHSHLDKYGDFLDEALNEIGRDQIFTIATAMDPPSYFNSLKIAERSDLVLATMGVHPKRAPEYAGRLTELGPLIEKSPAIGEIGLDFHWVEDRSHYPAQREVLKYCLAAAREQKKIVNLHTKGAELEILKLLEHFDLRRAIIHWYSGPMDILQELIQFGAFFTVGVEVLFSSDIREIARAIPLSQLLTESDNPGGLKWLNGTVGMPSVLIQVIEGIAGLKQCSPERLSSQIEQNFLRLICGDPWFADIEAKFARRRGSFDSQG